jgi:hypothetical protein
MNNRSDNKNATSQTKKQVLDEGKHFYIEDGKYVFTALFLTERGYCCRNGCRHCPYGYTKENQ